MSLEELWQLFPISLVPHNPEWSDRASEEMAALSYLLAHFHPVINHIGSTAIRDIAAKPIVDILVEISEDYNREDVERVMVTHGYILMSACGERMSFNKGYTPEGYAKRVFHIHIRKPGDNDEIFFRDYLNAHPETAREYEELKQSLLPRFRNDRDGYTAAKTSFVNHINALSRLQGEEPAHRGSH